MKIPNEALSYIAVASSNVATKLEQSSIPIATAAIASPSTNNHVVPHTSSSKPQIPRRLQKQLFPSTNNLRRLASSIDSGTQCDAAFLQCILSPTCRTCFATLQANDVDWTNVVPDTPCQDVLGFLAASGHCLDVRNGAGEETDIFCSAFDACVIWDEDDNSGSGGGASSSSGGPAGKGCG
eukprot:g10017.t1 g10017   contig4:1062941-1063483(+)